MTTARDVGTVLVLGSTGAVGSYIVEDLRARGVTTLQAGRRDGIDRYVDLAETSLAQYVNALDGVDVVVNASGLDDPRLLTIAADYGARYVDISASSSYIAALQQLSIATSAVVDVGLAPGLTNLLAAEVHSRNPKSPIDIVVILGAGEKHGAAATQWTYDLLG